MAFSGPVPISRRSDPLTYRSRLRHRAPPPAPPTILFTSSHRFTSLPFASLGGSRAPAQLLRRPLSFPPSKTLFTLTIAKGVPAPPSPLIKSITIATLTYEGPSGSPPYRSRAPTPPPVGRLFGTHRSSPSPKHSAALGLAYIEEAVRRVSGSYRSSGETRAKSALTDY